MISFSHKFPSFISLPILLLVIMSGTTSYVNAQGVTIDNVYECPFEERTNSIVVSLGNIIHVDDTYTHSVDIPEGTYSVEMYTWDSYVVRNWNRWGRILSENQKHETMHLEFYADEELIQRSNKTGDVPDHADPGYRIGSINDALSLDKGINRIDTVSSNKGESVFSGCARFTEISPSCGNGTVEVGEECDGGRSCTDGCFLVEDDVVSLECGNGIRNNFTRSNCQQEDRATVFDEPVVGIACNSSGLLSRPHDDAACIDSSISPPGIEGVGIVSDPWTWRCNEGDNYSTVCSATAGEPRGGFACDNHNLLRDPAAVDFCAVGTVDGLVGVGSTSEPWSWSCSNGSESVACVANLVQPVCGVAHGGTYVSQVPAESTLCQQGSPEAFSDSDGDYSWSCSNAQESVQCSASSACHSGSYSCGGTCIDISVSGPQITRFDTDGVPIPVDQVLTQQASLCGQPQCYLYGDRSTGDVGFDTSHKVPILDHGIDNVFYECEQPDDCEANGTCWGNSDPVRVSSTVRTMCTNSACSGSGQCIKSELVARSASACSQSCNADADCSDAGYREVGL